MKYGHVSTNSLSNEDARKLIHDYLVNGKKEIHNIVTLAVREQFKKLSSSDTDADELMRQPNIERLVDQAQADLEELFQKASGADSLAQIVEKLQNELDINGDGTVTKDEFVQKFASVYEKVCHTGRLKTTLYSIYTTQPENLAQLSVLRQTSTL